MKCNSLIVLATICLSLTPAHSHLVMFVYNGDTILIDKRDRVRYLGIDAPGSTIVCPSL